jgi:hypothetical protein
VNLVAEAQLELVSVWMMKKKKQKGRRRRCWGWVRGGMPLVIDVGADVV